MTKRDFLDTVFRLAPNEANAIMDAFDEYVDSNEPHWIPVTERLPNRDELVLVTYKTTSKIHLCKYIDDGSENSWWSYIDDCCAWNNVILAWMPLPEPYKEVKQNAELD